MTDLQQNSNVMDLISGNGFAKQGYPVRGLFSIPFKGLDENGVPMVLNEKGVVTSTDINFQERQKIQITWYMRDLLILLLRAVWGNMFIYKGFRLNVFANLFIR